MRLTSSTSDHLSQFRERYWNVTSKIQRDGIDFVIARSMPVDNESFINPVPDGPTSVWHQGTTQEIKWSTSYYDVHLSLWSTRSNGSSVGDTEVYNLSGMNQSQISNGHQAVNISPRIDDMTPTSSPYSFLVGENLHPSFNPWLFRLCDSSGELLLESGTFNVVSGSDDSNTTIPIQAHAISTSPSVTTRTEGVALYDTEIPKPTATLADPPMPDCSHYSIIFDFVDVHYWPTGTANTDCLSAITSQPPTMPLDLKS